MKQTKERRLMDLVKEQDSVDTKKIVSGRALVFNTRTKIYTDSAGVEYFEQINSGSLDNADLSDVFLTYNHCDNIMIMARTKNNTLKLEVDDYGLNCTAELADTTIGNDLYKLIKRGDIDKMSFEFEVDEDEYDSNTRTRTIKSFKKIYDVSAVNRPAYDNTSIYCRGFFEAQNEIENEKLRKQKLIIKTLL